MWKKGISYENIRKSCIFSLHCPYAPRLSILYRIFLPLIPFHPSSIKEIPPLVPTSPHTTPIPQSSNNQTDKQTQLKNN